MKESNNACGKKALLLAGHVFMVLSIISCWENVPDDYPESFVLADSAFMQGNYSDANRLMETNTLLVKQKDEPIQMYYQLLKLEQHFFNGDLSPSDYSIGDSTCNYYGESSDYGKYSRALWFMGQILEMSNDYPTAHEYYLKAQDAAVKAEEVRLQYLICKSQGDLFLIQQLYDDAIPCYRKNFQMASANRDTLRMAYGARAMGFVCTVNQEIDSIIYYNNLAISLSQKAHQPNTIRQYALYDLCDIYIQTEQWDKALAIMPRDSLNDANWAYWHLGQEHVDSAIYYFQRTLGRYKWQGEVEVLHLLGNLERERGNSSAAMGYYDRMAVAEDSLRQQQNTEHTIRMNAQYNFNLIKQQRDDMERKAKDMRRAIIIIVIVAVLLVAIGWLMFKKYRARKNAEVAQQRQVVDEAEERARRGQRQLENNNRRIKELESLLDAARLRNDELEAHRIEVEAEVLRLQNKSIEASKTRSEILLSEFIKSPLYDKLKSVAGKEPKTMTEGEWQQLHEALDDIYDNFTYRLRSLYKLSDLEMRICYLLKIDVPLSDIAAILCRSKSAVTLARERMYYKLAGTRGKAEQLDQMVRNF